MTTKLIAGEDILKGQLIHYDKSTELVMTVKNPITDGPIGVAIESISQGDEIRLFNAKVHRDVDRSHFNAMMHGWI